MSSHAFKFRCAKCLQDMPLTGGRRLIKPWGWCCKPECKKP